VVLAVDVYYKESRAKAVGALFEWSDEYSRDIRSIIIEGVEEYMPGEFYKRELPCILKVVELFNINDIEAILIDGYVYIDNDKQFGLGGRLWEALDERVPIIGVAKTSFFRNKNTIEELLRGESKNPLFISSIGVELNIATSKIKEMKGKFRIPDILKFLDTKTKEDNY
jgi:deoxyribonuclease V